MKNTWLFLLATVFVFFGISVDVRGADLRLLADRLWSGGTEAEAREVYKEIEDLPAEAYRSLLLNIYRSPLYRNTEAAPYLSAVVYHYYLKKESGPEVARTLFDLIHDESTPMSLKRDLLKDITTWYQGSIEDAVKEFKDFNFETQQDIWLMGQYAVAKLIQEYYREADKERRQQIDEYAGSYLSNNITRLLAGFKEEQKGNWAAKVLASYRKIIGPRFDKTFVYNLRRAKGPLSRRLSILSQISGWGHKSEDVLGYLKEMKSDFALERDKGNEQDRAVIERLIKFHEHAAESSNSKE